MAKVINRYDAVSLGVILDAAHNGRRVRFIDPNDELIEATARHLVYGTDPSDWTFPGSQDDILGCAVRFTTNRGYDVAYSIPWLIGAEQGGAFGVVDNRPGLR